MNKYQKAFIERPGYYLMHYNHNHDALGRFAKSVGGVYKSVKYGGPLDPIFGAMNKHDAKKREKRYDKELKAKGIVEKDLPEAKQYIRKDRELNKLNKQLSLEYDKEFRNHKRPGTKTKDLEKKIDARHDKLVNEFKKYREPDYKAYKKSDDITKDFEHIDWRARYEDDVQSYIKSVHAYMSLQNEIEKKSVNWYESEPKSKRTRKTYALRDSGHINEDQFDERLLGDVLQDLGYKNTKKARKMLYDSGTVFVD